MPTPESAAVQVEELTVRFGSPNKNRVTAVDSVSFQVGRGEIVALLGPNGAGKTTLLETLEGYRTPDSGSVRVLGHDPKTERTTLATKWGVMPQAGGIPMGLTVKQSLRLFSGLHGSNPPDSAALLEMAGLSDKGSRRWRRLSGGEQQRLSLVLALCGGTEVLLLDEPTAAVDAAGRATVLEIVTDRAAKGAGVLITTHRFDDVEAIADRVVIMNHGAVVASGTVAELTSGFEEVRFETTRTLSLEDLSDSIGHEARQTSPGRYIIEAPPLPALVASLTGWLAENGHPINNLHAGQRRLEDVFLELTSDSPPRKAPTDKSLVAKTEGEAAA